MELTAKAAERIKRIRWIKKAEGFLRIRAKKRGEGRWAFEMGFDLEREGDVKVETRGLTALMDKTTWKVLEGAVVDFEAEEETGTFIFSRKPPDESAVYGETKPAGLRGVAKRVFGRLKTPL